ncbi:MAG: FHA domain-containing protein [Gammaproteobacteria bacterium]|nr:FHA domain-containing protein [Gammaproteobacteria bacterium]
MALLLQLVDRVVSSKLELDIDILTVGRNQDNDLVIDDIAVSGLHAQFEREEDPYYEGHYRYYLHDLGSTNGSFVNGSRVVARKELTNNDMVKIGWNEFKFIGDDYDKHEATAHILNNS